jgi:hypothetical protein
MYNFLPKLLIYSVDSMFVCVLVHSKPRLWLHTWLSSGACLKKPDYEQLRKRKAHLSLSTISARQQLR